MILKLRVLLFCFVLALSWSCDSDFKVDDSVLADYNLFFDYLENDYSYRDEFPIQEYKNKYLGEITSTPTQKKLAEVLLKVIDDDIQDPHLYFKDETDIYSIAGIVKPIAQEEEVEPKFAEVDILGKTHFYTYGTIKTNSDIGYIYIDEYNKEIGGTSSLAIDEGVYKIDDIIKALNAKNINALIVDIRSDAGGSHYIPRYIASRFLNKTADYLKDIYPIGDGKSMEKIWSLSPEGENGFRTKKIALLTNYLTCSGGEFFVLAMLTRDNLIHIGSRTNGCAGNISDKDLANGWQLRITSSKTEKPDGTKYFKVGIQPSIEVKNVAPGTPDLVINRAIVELTK